jgi:hypothetical protein
MSEMFREMENTQTVEKKAEFRASDIILGSAISTQNGGDYWTLENLRNNLKKMSVRSVYYSRNSVFGLS